MNEPLKITSVAIIFICIVMAVLTQNQAEADVRACYSSEECQNALCSCFSWLYLTSIITLLSGVIFVIIIWEKKE